MQIIDPWASFSYNIVIINSSLVETCSKQQHDRSCQNCPTFKMVAPITTLNLAK